MDSNDDIEVLIKKAKHSIKSGDYKQARAYLRKAATLAPMNADIREMLEYTLTQKPREQKAPGGRGLFQTERERPAPGHFAASQPRRHGSFIGKIIIAFLVTFVIAGGVAAFFLLRPRSAPSPVSGGVETPAAAPTATGTAPTAPAATAAPTPVEASATADSLMNQGKYEEAEQALKTALEASPANKDALTKKLADVQFAWGKELVNNVKFEQAVKVLVSASEVQTENAEVFFWLGQAHLGKARHTFADKDYADAEKSLRRSIEIDPDMLKAYYWLGRAYSQQAKPIQASKYWNMLIKRAPESDEAKKAEGDLKALDLK